jgi:hypothetical protein
MGSCIPGSGMRYFAQSDTIADPDNFPAHDKIKADQGV